VNHGIVLAQPLQFDSNVLIVGAYSEDELEDGVSGTLTNPGSAYFFERNIGGTWIFTQKNCSK